MSAALRAESGMLDIQGGSHPAAVEPHVRAVADAPAPQALETGPAVDRTVTLWRDAERQLSPIIGRRGALALNRAAFDWLPDPQHILHFEDAEPRLREAFAPRRPADADLAATALSETLRDLLASLVGASLAHQLLRVVHAHRGDAAIDFTRPA